MSSTIYGDLLKVKLQNLAEFYESDAGHFVPSRKNSKCFGGNTDAIKVVKLYSEDSKDEFPSLFLVYRKNAESLLTHDFRTDLMDVKYFRDVDENTYKGYVTDTDPTAELSGRTKSMDMGDEANKEIWGKKEPLYLTIIDGQTDRLYIPGNISGSAWHYAKHNQNLSSQEADVQFVISNDFETEKDKTPGYAIVGGICTANAVATIQYTGLDSGFIMAHEMGHVFGCQHDNDTNCRSDEGGVMACSPKIDRLKKWSTCSADTISQKLRNMTIDKTYCLKTVEGKGIGLVKYPGQYVFDEQCATRWRDPTAIMHKDANCKVLNCNINREVIQYNQTPLDGTFCTIENGKEVLRLDGEKICVSRRCIDVKEMQNMPKGSWGNWNSGPCIGLGNEFKIWTRKCKRVNDNTVLGPYCDGTRIRVEKCQNLLDLKDRELKDRALKDRALKDRALNDRALNDRALKDRALKDRALKDRALKDRALKDRALNDRALKDRALKDRALKLNLFFITEQD
ncbi:unnamed protein product [Gordionus sp. m RMFG-2023]